MLLLNANNRQGSQPADYPVTDKQVVATGLIRLTLQAPEVATIAKPGQFVMLYLPAGRQQLLPRPLSIFAVNKEAGQLTLLFQVKGPGTAELAGLTAGASCKMLGPLGSAFPPLADSSILVAGGLGVVPLAFLAASSKQQKTMIYAARSADQLCYPADDLEISGLTLLEATDDGSSGFRGTAIDLLSNILFGDFGGLKTIYACGPRSMLKAVQDLSKNFNYPAWISLEERMACGIGACLGCTVATTAGNKRVCYDGPVFNAAEVIFDA